MPKVLVVKCGGTKPNTGDLWRKLGRLNLHEQYISTVICHGPSYLDVYNALMRYKKTKVCVGGTEIIHVYAGRYIKTRGFGKTQLYDPHAFNTGAMAGKAGIMATAGLGLALLQVVAKNHYFLAFSRTKKNHIIKREAGVELIMTANEVCTYHEMALNLAIKKGLSKFRPKDTLLKGGGSGTVTEAGMIPGNF